MDNGEIKMFDSFGRDIYDAAITKNIFEDKRSLEQSIPENCKDEHWRRSNELYQKLTTEEKEVFLNILRKVMINITLNVLGVLEGDAKLSNGETFETEIEMDGVDMTNVGMTKSFLSYVVERENLEQIVFPKLMQLLKQQ